MPDLQDGESIEMKGSGAKPYVLKNIGGVYSCTCRAPSRRRPRRAAPRGMTSDGNKCRHAAQTRTMH